MKAMSINWGVDYLRITSRDKGDQRIMEEEYQRIRKIDEGLGYKSHAGGAFGFYGVQTRHALLATNEDWDMFQVSGRAAKGLEKIAKNTQNCTRIDIQVTFRVEEGKVAETIMQMYKNSMAAPYAEGRRPGHKLVMEEWEAQTIYVGSRSSDFYIRVYDKFAESQDENYKNCVRVEVEIKGKASKQIWKKMASENMGEGYLLQMLYNQANKVGIKIPVDVGGADVEKYKPIMQRAIEKTMAWFQRAVVPSMSRIILEYGWYLPVKILLENILTEREVLTITENIAIIWGS